MNCSKCRKAYVSVNLDVERKVQFSPGHPLEGRCDFQIDQILYKCRATSKKVGGAASVTQS
jgi:hypothetical protein